MTREYAFNMLRRIRDELDSGRFAIGFVLAEWNKNPVILLALAHQIRDYRNDVIHESLRDARFDFPNCLRGLGRYLRWLPLNW
jgi:hypothetical protein